MQPARPGTLAFGACVREPLGGWTGHYRKADPLAMRRSLHDFCQIKYRSQIMGKLV
jgi:hypothetical protein